MKSLTSIVAMNHSQAIGVRNGLPWRLRTDLAFFKETTVDHTIIMGRKTFDSLGRRPLPGRRNIVVSHTLDLQERSPSCFAACSIDEALWIANRETADDEECFVVGGATMYEQFSVYVDRYLVTLVEKEIVEADTVFTRSILNDDDWSLRLLGSWPENPPIDEAAFAIFELQSLRASEVAERRLERISEHLERTRRAPIHRLSHRRRGSGQLTERAEAFL